MPTTPLADLRSLLLQLYLKNNPKLEHQVFIYSYRGIVDVSTNPFHYVNGALPYTAKKAVFCKICRQEK
ncbi:hypothetical protein [Wielerella bovis]|uniref:hypothetical protein n=1 Tax=Wielerella bovis TaxID=2917790 RepID=UPI003211D4F5